MSNLEININDDIDVQKQLKECPIVNINEYNLEESIIKLINDKKKIDFLSIKSINYWQKYHSIDSVYKSIIDDYNSIC